MSYYALSSQFTIRTRIFVWSEFKLYLYYVHAFTVAISVPSRIANELAIKTRRRRGTDPRPIYVAANMLVPLVTYLPKRNARVVQWEQGMFKLTIHNLNNKQKERKTYKYTTSISIYIYTYEKTERRCTQLEGHICLRLGYSLIEKYVTFNDENA